jgi:hypothetical protein
MIPDWLFVASTVFLGVSLGVLAYAVRQAKSRKAWTGSESAGDAGAQTTDDTVQCPACGTTNERGYRYCQECLEELPASVSYVPDSVGTDNRQIP